MIAAVSFATELVRPSAIIAGLLINRILNWQLAGLIIAVLIAMNQLATSQLCWLSGSLVLVHCFSQRFEDVLPYRSVRFDKQHFVWGRLGHQIRCHKTKRPLDIVIEYKR